VDPDSDRIDPLYEKVLGGKGELITIKSFEEKYISLEAELGPKANELIFLHHNAEYHHSDEIIKRVHKQLGIRDHGPKRLDNIGVVEELVREGVEQRGTDLVVIDSFNGLFGDPRKVTRYNVQRITGLAAKYGITVLVLHHLNKSGEMSGPETIRDCFYAVYKFSEEVGVIPLKDNEGIIRLDAEKLKGAKKKSYRIKRTFNDDLSIDYEPLSETDFLCQKTSKDKGPNLADRIKQELSEYENNRISFEDLRTWLGGNPPCTDGAIKNRLKELCDLGMIEKANGKTWAIINVLKM
jgi:hypothetical protein